jgi:hypothetical protein
LAEPTPTTLNRAARSPLRRILGSFPRRPNYPSVQPLERSPIREAERRRRQKTEQDW